jgi:hypothetical protein
MNVHSVPLSGLLQVAAEAFFQTDLSGLELHFGSRARRFRSAACAWGNDIYISVPLATWPSALLELLGHELTHVVQQRQGRVRQTTTIAGCPANDDPALEQEAVELGRRFARGMDAPLPQRPAVGFQPVLQRSVTVGDKVLSSQADLGKAGTIVDLIDGGSSWLSWAIGNTDARYKYADAGSLVTGLQLGLHGTDLALLRQLRLLLHPLKLIELQADELLLLAAAEQAVLKPDDAALRQATKILNNKHNLYCQADLQVGIDFLLQTGVRDQPVFSNLTLAGQLALFAMIDEASGESAFNPMLQKEAASFAVFRAQSVFEFVDYYKFYMATIDDPAHAAGGAAARSRKAESLHQSIEPLLYGYLLCPSFPGVLAPEEVIAAVQKWSATGNVLGFSRLSQGITQIAQYADLQGAKGQATSALINQFSAQSRSLFREELAGSVKLTQDGRERYYSYQGASGSVRLCHSSDGDLSLASFRASS